MSNQSSSHVVVGSGFGFGVWRNRIENGHIWCVAIGPLTLFWLGSSFQISSPATSNAYVADESGVARKD